MKRITLLICFTVCLFSSLIAQVFAHPGRTDENGGHTNRSTGEYHYHHGYPEHDHYDMDGDGQIDCPYEFDDKTNHNSGGGNSSNKVTPSYISPAQTEEPTEMHKESNDKESNSDSNNGEFILLVMMLVLLCGIPALLKTK
jgi:hypothetical protein